MLNVIDVEREVMCDDGSISSSVSMVEDNFVSTMSIEEQLVFIDSCASQKLFIVADASYVERVDLTVRSSINLTNKSAIMEVTGTGSYGDWRDVKICPESRKNIFSTSRLQVMG